MNTKSANWEQIGKPIVVLSVIALLVSAALGYINDVTAPVIEANKKAATLAAYLQVMPSVQDASALETIDDYETTGITGAVKSADGCYAFTAEEKGFDGGVLTVNVGFDADGKISGVVVDATAQTAGVGSHLAESEYTDQFVGLDTSANVAIGENGLDGRTGATITSKALFAAMNDCINCYNEVALGSAATVVETYTNPTKEEAIASLAPGAAAVTAPAGCDEAYSNGDVTVLLASAKGAESTVTVAVGFDAAGAVTGIWVDAPGETQGAGCMEPAFTSLFTGLTDTAGVEAVDGISGSTYTSNAVKKAVEACISGFAAM